ncbi:hypothetical protein V5799_021619 [Amblyomma americanum]|uniref:ABC transporter domain-containing protein n=1 Tax=Amblyomma americanum TaxID=6943 RepID=A0AAQ4FND1_AMBAM
MMRQQLVLLLWKDISVRQFRRHLPGFIGQTALALIVLYTLNNDMPGEPESVVQRGVGLWPTAAPDGDAEFVPTTTTEQEEPKRKPTTRYTPRPWHRREHDRRMPPRFFEARHPLDGWHSGPGAGVEQLCYVSRLPYHASIAERAAAMLNISKVHPLKDYDDVSPYFESIKDSPPGSLIAVVFHTPSHLLATSALRPGAAFDDSASKEGEAGHWELDYEVRVHGIQFDVNVRYRRFLMLPAALNLDAFSEMTYLLPIQYAVETAFIEVVSKAKNESRDYEVRLQRFPYPSLYPEDFPTTYARVAIRFAIAFWIPFTLFVIQIVDERASGMRTQQRIYGVLGVSYWLSHYLRMVTTVALIGALMLFFLYGMLNDRFGNAFISATNPGLVYAVLFFYGSALAVHGMLLSLFFDSTRMAGLLSSVYWFLTLMLPYLFLQNPYGFGYYLISRLSKLMTSAFPGMFLHWCWMVIERLERFEEGGGLGNFADPSHIPDNVTILQLMIVSTLSSLVLVVLLWYIDCVTNCNRTKIARPWYFPFKATYWKPPAISAPQSGAFKTRCQYYEQEPTAIQPIVRINGISKRFETHVIINDVSFNIFGKQITVLLAPPNYGKSTIMKMITGSIPPSSGTISVGVHDVVLNGDGARRLLAYCPGDSILYGDLTVEEHLIFFGMAKGISSSKVRFDVGQLMDDIGLSFYRTRRADDLTHSIQRLLSTAIAIMPYPDLWLHKGPGYKSSGVEAVLRKHHSRAERVEDKPGIVVYRLTGSSDALSTLMRDLFADLENSKASLGVAKMGVIVTTLEDILEGIHEQRSLLRFKRVANKRHSSAALAVKEAVSRLKIDMSTLEARMEPEDPGPGPVLGGGGGIGDALRALRNRTVFVEATTRKRLHSLFHKRVLQWKHTSVQRTLRWLLPTALLLLGGYCESSMLSGTPRHEVTLTYGVHNIVGGAVGFCGSKGGRFQQFMAQSMCPVLEENGVRLETIDLTNVAPQLLALAEKDVYSYVLRYQIGVVSSESASVYAEETVGVLLSFFREFELGSPRRQNAGYVVHVVLVRVLCAVFVPTALCYHAAHFVVVVLGERVSGAKHQQLLTGVGGALFWLGHLLFDGCRGLLHAFAFTAATAAFRPFLSWSFVHAIFVVFALYTLVAISLAYLFSLWFDNAPNAFYTMATMYLVGGVLGSLFSTAMDLYVFSPSAQAGIRGLITLPFRWVPTYPVTRGITKLILLSKEHLICSEDGLSLKQYCREDFVRITQRLEECCPPLKNAHSVDQLQPFGVGLNTGIYEIFSLILEGGFCFVLVSFLDSELLQRLWSRFRTSEPATPSKPFTDSSADDVMKERQQIEDIYNKRDFEQHGLLVRGLSKTYGFIRPRCGIDNVSFCVRQGECLGFVGVLGTGKTTLLGVLGGELFPTSGEAYMGPMSLSLHYRQWLSNVGYVPYAGGLLEALTGREMICLLAVLRGVQDVPRITRSLLRIVDLAEPDAAIASYGVGARVQLSLALALMAFPRLYLLDLPDLDTQTRAVVRRVLECLRQISTVVLACEHLHHYESACDRIAIIAAGRIECIGSVKELSDKYCRGTTITLYTFPDRRSDLQHQRFIVLDMVEHFPSCTLVRCYEGLLEFRIFEPPASLCETFDRLLFLKRKHKFHFFYVSDTTLDQIFASLGRKHVGLKGSD